MDVKYSSLPQQDRWIQEQSDTLMEQMDKENKSVTWAIVALSWLFVILTLPFSLIFCIKVIPSYQRGIVFRLGRKTSDRPLGPGTVFVLPCIDRFKKVDLRTKAFNVAPQECLTRDQALVSIGAMVYYKVDNPVRMVTVVQNVMHALRSLAHTTLQSILREQTLGQVEGESLGLGDQFRMYLQDGVKLWGISIERAELSMARVVHPPGLLQRVNEMKDQQPLSSNAQAGTAAISSSRHCTLDHSEIVRLVRPKIAPERNLVKTVRESFEFYAHGKSACCVYLDLVNGDGSAGEGAYPFGNPSAKMFMNYDDIVSFLTGSLNPVKSYKDGSLKMSGSTNAVLKLYKAFSEITV